MKPLILAGICLGLSACATWSPETRVEEGTFDALQILDGLQTANIAHTPGMHEAESAWEMGREPSARSAAAFMAAGAVAHFAVTAWMCAHHAPAWAVRTWELTSIGWSAHDVGVNFALGIKP